MDHYTIALIVFVGWVIYTVIWRAYLSPLAQIPGPRMAALTYLQVLCCTTYLR